MVNVNYHIYISAPWILWDIISEWRFHLKLVVQFNTARGVFWKPLPRPLAIRPIPAWHKKDAKHLVIHSSSLGEITAIIPTN